MSPPPLVGALLTIAVALLIAIDTDRGRPPMGPGHPAIPKTIDHLPIVGPIIAGLTAPRHLTEPHTAPETVHTGYHHANDTPVHRRSRYRGSGHQRLPRNHPTTQSTGSTSGSSHTTDTSQQAITGPATADGNTGAANATSGNAANNNTTATQICIPNCPQPPGPQRDRAGP